MSILKTIVATAVIVFAITTVAMAGVDRITGQNGPASQVRAQKVPATVTLTARQFQQLVRGQNQARAGTSQRHPRRVQNQDQAGRQWNNQGPARTSAQNNGGYSSQSGAGTGNRCYNDGSTAGSASGSHSGDCWDGGGCW